MGGTGGTTDRQKLTVADILKRNAAAYVKQYPRQAVPQVQSTLAKLSLCRTTALGGHVYRCGGCQHEVVVPNSCGDRYCPACSGARRSDWMDSASDLILDGVDHFQVVFTLPNALSRLALGNRKEIYDLLFASAWSSLKQTMQSEHGIDSAALMVLHTWNQKLDAHAHVHAVVPGCGPATEGSGIKFAQRGDDETSRGGYLVDADALRAAYREAFLRGLTKLHQQGKLKLTGEFEWLLDDTAWNDWLTELAQTTWVSYIQPPPQPGQSAEHVLKYLARYLAGGPISERRIVSTDTQTITFMARAGETAGGDARKVPLTLSQVEFTRRWCLHVLPSGYTRTRRFGGWSNPRRRRYLVLLAMLTIQPDDSAVPLPEPFTEPVTESVSQAADSAADASDRHASDRSLCPTCQRRMIPQGMMDKPSWSRVMNSRHRPPWYQRY